MQKNSSKSTREQAKDALETVALREGKSVREVRDAICDAIRCGMENPDPNVKKLWDSIPRTGDAVEPEGLIAWAITQIAGR